MGNADTGTVTYEDLVQSLRAGEPGIVIEYRLELLGGGEGDYTVYWPKDSIRVIEGSSYAVARAVQVLLRDPRTRWWLAPTDFADPVIARVRRELATSDAPQATETQVRSSTVYVRDRLLPGDITTRPAVNVPMRFRQAGDPDPVFDFSTLPQN